MSLKFGTSGLRGLSVDLEGPATALYTAAFARHLLSAGIAQQGDDVLVGRDFRASSPAIAAIAIAALRKAGLSPRDCGALPTPALALLGLSRRAACLMVTGSHIPADRNGIKFYRPDGEIDKADEAAITTAADAIRAEGKVLDAAQETADDLHAAAMALYGERNRALLPAGSLTGLRVGVYQHSTVARDLFVSVLAHYGADVVALGRSEHFIPVDTEAVSAETVALLQGWAVEHGLHAIISADGDGDRPLIADETGTPIRGDLIGLVASRFLGASAIATPVTSNSGIEATVAGTVLRTKVGSPFVIAAMNEAVAAGQTAVAGFEANGGTLTATPFTVNGHVLAPLPTRDSLMPVLAVLALRAAEGRPLSDIATGFALPAAGQRPAGKLSGGNERRVDGGAALGRRRARRLPRADRRAREDQRYRRASRDAGRWQRLAFAPLRQRAGNALLMWKRRTRLRRPACLRPGWPAFATGRQAASGSSLSQSKNRCTVLCVQLSGRFRQAVAKTSKSLLTPEGGPSTWLSVAQMGGIGRRASFRCWYSKGCGGSSPLLGTKFPFPDFPECTKARFYRAFLLPAARPVRVPPGKTDSSDCALASSAR